MDAFVKRLPKPQSEVKSSHAQPAPEQADERPSKRVKKTEIKDSDDDYSEESSFEDTQQVKGSDKPPLDDDDKEQDAADNGRKRLTDFESVLPPLEVDEKAIEEYEVMKSSQLSVDDDDATEKPEPVWVKGRSSIYVDAFNLALDTVLDEESHLFDEREMEVFRQWKDLDYEAQYL